jgi:hypothetical protein
MAYTLIKSGNTEYAVDWDVVERFCKSYWFNYYQDQYAQSIKLSESSWYNPFSWKLPEIQTAEIPWEQVQTSTASAVASEMFSYRRSASSDMRGVANEVKQRVEQTRTIKRSFKDWLRSIEDDNIAAMHKAEDDYTGYIEACRFVRDTSADVVAIGSTIATGGAATGLLAGSSVLKGVYKYQDTGRVGAAVVYGAGSMALGAFKVSGAKLTTGGEYTLIIAQGFLEGATSLASGKSFGDAVHAGGLKIAGAGGAQAIFGGDFVKRVFAKIPVPFTVFSVKTRSGAEYMAEDVADQLTEKTVKKLTEKGLKATVGRAVSPAASAPAAAKGSGFIDEVPIEEMLLLDLAIVNMDKGIGRGW